MRAGRKLSCERARRDRNRGDEGRRRSGHGRIIPEEWLKSTPVYARSATPRNRSARDCRDSNAQVSYLRNDTDTSPRAGVALAQAGAQSAMLAGT
jgi:hypothetical protein